ncbi:MAG: CmcJ/NvfI family oxidoreductase [Cyanobacteria bacterium P01_F01_bin.150]
MTLTSMPLDSWTLTTSDRLTINEHNNRVSNTTTAFEARTQDSLTAPLRFIIPQAEKPFFRSAAITGGTEEFFFETEERVVPIANLRAVADRMTLDKEGFDLLTEPSTVVDFHDDAEVEGRYFDEIRNLLARQLGAEEVIIFDATRRSDAQRGAANRDGSRKPASLIHVDYTATSGPGRLAGLIGEERLASLLKAGKRIVQVNVWRSIAGVVQRSPLALADASSIAAHDLYATEQIFPDRVGEIYHLSHNPTQRWYYAPAMTQDEVLLIKGWDSARDRARFTPHTAFELPDAAPNAPARESLEVRTYAIVPNA